MYAAPSAIATSLPRCTLAPDGRSGRTTAYIWLAPAVARPIFCSATLRKTSDIRNRYAYNIRFVAQTRMSVLPTEKCVAFSNKMCIAQTRMSVLPLSKHSAGL